MTTLDQKRRKRWSHHPPLGVRFSATDALVLLAAGGFATGSREVLGALAWLPLVALAHFFLFCNIFRIHRRLELIWAGAFVVNFAAWALTAGIDWAGIIAVQTPLTVLLISIEIAHPRYHGIGSIWLARRREKGASQ